MKYAPTPDFHQVTDALNFDTTDCHVVGGCDLYTTKAASEDKKLYKKIDDSLQTEHASLLSLAASLSSSQMKEASESLDLSRASPFGNLSKKSSRKAFAYLIATLNASNPDHDYSKSLRPNDFRREKYLKTVIDSIDSTLSSLRPRYSSSYQDQPPHWSNEVISTVPQTPHGSEKWNPRMWRMIDKEMVLRDCRIYSYTPEEEDSDDDEESQLCSLWSFHYFFFNKKEKRVCYLYLRGFSRIGDILSPTTPIKTKRPASGTWSLDEDTGNKRARYWLGDQADQAEWVDYEDETIGGEWEEENIEDIEILDEEDEPIYIPSDTEEETGNESPCKGKARRVSSDTGSDMPTTGEKQGQGESPMRTVSEEVAASMDP